ncbi:hypothetical protein Pan216_28830 [Planctomycetes bacterium Pan216]|uniref:Iron export permease protein FetB n=1 Tax=Kolteria novifilia TaxID=2527975 RepID=A0A518B4W7_9BACT|nr:hypothetical protein Pan216_28830 [Planctomycetes bacterium Pan216]
MSAEYLSMGYGQILAATLLIIVNMGISLVLGLALERRLLVASARTVVQLSLLGFVLGWVYQHPQWYVLFPVAGLMTFVAGHAAIRRVRRTYPKALVTGTTAMAAGSWSITLIGLIVIVRPTPWYAPQYAIPLLGMILGNTLNGISLGIDRFGEELVNKRDRIETLLALGATRWEAAHEPMREALRTGMTPIINSMSVVGIVSIPGMMTGQLLAGVVPVEAVRYQMIIMFMIASGTALGTLLAVLLSYFRLFSNKHQLLVSQLTSR